MSITATPTVLFDSCYRSGNKIMFYKLRKLFQEAQDFLPGSL